MSVLKSELGFWLLELSKSEQAKVTVQPRRLKLKRGKASKAASHPSLVHTGKPSTEDYAI